MPTPGRQAAAQSGPLLVNVVEYDIQPGQVDAYLAALKENGAATVKEPGCREFNILVSQKDPNHVLIFEVDDYTAAAQAHRENDHYKNVRDDERYVRQARRATVFVGGDEYEGQVIHVRR